MEEKETKEPITKEMVMEVLQEMGLRPKNREEEEYIFLRYKLLGMFIEVMDEDYIHIVEPNIYTIDNDKEQMTALYVCNKFSRDYRHVKVWLNEEMDNICASSDFYVEDRNSLKSGLKHGLDLLAEVAYHVSREMKNYMAQAGV